MDFLRTIRLRSLVVLVDMHHFLGCVLHCRMHLCAINNIALVEAQPDKPLVDILNYRLIIAAIGESAGSFLGGWIVPALRPAGLTAWYWCALALVGIMPAVVTNQIRKRGQRVIRH